MNPGVATAQILFSVTVKNPQEVADIQVRACITLVRARFGLDF